MRALVSGSIYLKTTAGVLSNDFYTLDQLIDFLDLGFVKYASNPVLAKGSAGQWDDWGVRELSPVIDEDGEVIIEADGIWAYYWGRPDASGTMRIGLVKSTDGGYTWTRYGSNPVISPTGTPGSWYETHIHQPSVIKRNDGTRMMAASGIDSGGVYKIGVFTSADGLTWADQGSKLVLADFSWDGVTGVSVIAVPSVIKRSSGDYLMTLECFKSGGGGGQWRVFGATSSDFTGTWTPLNGGLPIFQETGAGWESNGVANAHVIEVKAGLYLMAYNGNDGGATIDWEIGFASSSDLSTWDRYSGNPVLSKGAGGAWDNEGVEADFLVKEKTDYLRLYYHGFSTVDSSHQVGLATAG